uniref:Uncharacterized protein n=1 Tax=Anguilla anguilla TaxID=7936 RepID=A0A0E9SEU6_ANGAN
MARDSPDQSAEGFVGTTPLFFESYLKSPNCSVNFFFGFV